MQQGKFIISLDFELHWGAAEKWDLNAMKGYFDATRTSIPEVLALFSKYDIHATWATVGFLFAKSRQQLLEFLPTQRPTYDNKSLLYYKLIDNGEVGTDEINDPYHFAPSLISQIIATPNQELGTHTFAHYYCNEAGQNEAQFEADIQAAQALAKENYNTILQSLVFPRNQFNPAYSEVARRNGIKVVRSNPDVWFWNSRSKFSPIARALDTLMPISSSVTFKQPKVAESQVLLLPASRFLRPYTHRERHITALKLARIKSEMLYAAKNGTCYHLWWHPHNFGYETHRNMNDLEDLLKYYKQLNADHGFASASMIEMYQ
ncbi:MAG TPA: polysaccharide deacetylase family protein [Flavobacterium sp.]|nr:polysaccharide deacetylase family protein [Flavobacterium sp.]